VLRVRWKAGCVAMPQHPILISATRFTFDHVWRMPLIFWHARRLRREWTSFRGGIGVSMCAGEDTPEEQADAALDTWLSKGVFDCVHRRLYR
jgi:hypothetical protein